MEEKPFDLTAIVLLIILAVLNDTLIVLADFAFLIPVIGQITFLAMMAASFVIWAIIFLWFTLKLGFAGPIGLIQIGGGILAEIGVPVRTATVITGIVMANNPKAAKVAKLVTGAAAIAATGGAAAVVEGGAVAGGAAAGAEAVAAGEAAAGAAEGAAGEIATKAAAEAGARGEIGGAYEYSVEKKAQKEAFEEKGVEAKAPEEEGTGGRVIEAAERFGQKEEGGGEGEKEKTPEIEAARLGGAYAETEEEQQKRLMVEQGLTGEVGTADKKTDTVNVDDKTGAVDLSTPNDNIIDGRARFGGKPPDNEQLKKAA